MSQSKIILLNGVKSTGKDSAIHHLRSLGYPLVRREAKGKLHELTMAFFCIQPERYWEIYEDRVLKETLLEEFRISIDYMDGVALERFINSSLLDREGVLGRDTFIDSKYRYNVKLSLREAMIYISEVICKPRFGDNYFGVARAKAIVDGETAVDSSTGFVSELPPLIERLGQENILLIRVHREGATFEGDSRNYIPDGVIDNTVDVQSVYGYLDEYLEHVEKIVDKFLNK
jgi:hypothetical protein